MKKIKVQFTSLCIIVLGAIIRLIYVLNTSVYERSHDVGAYSTLTDSIVNPGHLGYIEYIAKFNHLPDFDPFAIFSYYHPPLHHILSAIVVKISSFFTDSVDACFENVQLLVLFFSVITLIFSYKILKEVVRKDWQIIPGLLLITFHPSMILMCGYVNNDMLTVVFEIIGIYYTIKWMKDYQFKYLIFMALSLGLGMCTKISAIVIAVPMGVLMLMHLIDEIRLSRNNGEVKNVTADSESKSALTKCIREYLVFAVISIGLGLSWTVRNFILFGTKPGIASATPEDIKYMGNYSVLTRLGIPMNWELEYPFHNEYGSVSDNAWLIMFKTSIFGEVRPDISSFAIFLCRIALVVTVVLGLLLTFVTIYTAINDIRHGNRKLGILVLSGWCAVLLTYMVFVIKYPYTCSCDFRYIIISLLFGAIGLSRLKGLSFKSKHSEQN